MSNIVAPIMLYERFSVRITGWPLHIQRNRSR